MGVPCQTNVGFLLRMSRRRSKIAPHELAKALGVSRPYITQLEIGKRAFNPTWQFICGMCKIINIPISELYQAWMADEVTKQNEKKKEADNGK